MNRTLRHKRRTTRQRSTSYRPQLDLLEQRSMLAADLGFDPLLTSATTLSTTNVGGTTPFTLSTDLTQTVIQRRTTDADLGAYLGQNTINESGPYIGRFLFSSAMETTFGDSGANPIIGTLNRTDLATGQTINLLDIAIADGQDPDDPTASVEQNLTLQNLHAIRWTPWGTLLVAEAIAETQSDVAGNPIEPDPDAPSALNGLVYEVLDPTSDRPTIVARPNVGSANFQGLDFDSEGNLYYSDNNGNNSTLFRFVSDGMGASPLESGVLQVLNVTTGFGLGDAEWVTVFDPLDPGTYPEDPAISVRLALGNLDLLPQPAYTTFEVLRDVEVGFGNLTGEAEQDEILYVAVQLANRVLAIDLDGGLGTDFPTVYNYFTNAVDADFNDPVDLSVDAEGRVYIGEAIDPPPGANEVAAGNDVWVGADDNEDVDDPFTAVLLDGGDAAGRLASLRVSNSSVAGLYVNPFNNNQIYVNVSSAALNKNAIVRFDAFGGFTPSAELVDVGNGDTVLVIVGTEVSDRIMVSGFNSLTVRIGSQIFRGLTPSQSVLIYGLGGSDTITTGSGTFFDYTIFGGAGGDYIVTGNGFDSIAGEEGNDRIQAGNGNNTVSGGEGNDTLTTGRGDDYLSGDAGNDRLVSGDGNDTMFGGDGNDTMLGGRGDDFMDGGAGNDGLDGYIGNDILVGQAGNDRLIGGRDRDVLIGGQDKDLLYAGEESDLLIADITAADGDEAALRGLLELWLMSTVSPEAGDDILAYLDELDGDSDGDGIKQDNSLVDLMDGGPGASMDDLYFRFGTRDILYRVTQDDVVVIL